MYAIKAKKLKKTYGDFTAVNGIDLTVKKGSIFAFLGPNGAGKTTTIRMLATLIKPDQGEASLFGYDLIKQSKAVRQRISLTGQYASIDEALTGQENLILIARLLGFSVGKAKQRASELLESFGLDDAAKRQVKTYSGGMRRRLDIAASLIVTPELLFLDEPTTGLDPRSRSQVWQVVQALAEAGTTILLTTQYLEEADQLADHIAVINKGRIVAEGTAAQLKSSLGSGVLTLQLANQADLMHARSLLAGNQDIEKITDAKEGELRIKLKQPQIATQLLVELGQAGIKVPEFSLGQPSLDEVFLALTEER
ncbi:ABC-2 type transport system ATP-binding protein [Amphibacillus marinus]|uniref:ABC-2 type transport system ATP-binding protein n=1 Tax=Amphibacillus marinus TaxID=872970 RepID=A0A1H8QTH8_9BACI|nr:ATP-binding cassette domain-containing protein [Amphibacillus marinus]SEO57164.1 ABC-2 type transport system ATP-binding protein [Amphibacillus marinus]